MVTEGETLGRTIVVVAASYLLAFSTTTSSPWSIEIGTEVDDV